MFKNYVIGEQTRARAGTNKRFYGGDKTFESKRKYRNEHFLEDVHNAYMQMSTCFYHLELGLIPIRF